MKKKNGFTLIEMLGILVVLSIIVMISVPAITSMLKQANKQKYDEWLQNLYIASEQYVEGHREEFAEANSGGTSYLSIQLLLKKGYLKNSIKDPKTGQDVTDIGIVEIKPNDEHILTYNYKLKKEIDAIHLSVAMNPDPNVEAWTSNDVVLTATTTQTPGIRVDQYSFDDGKNWQTSPKKTVTKNETYKVLARDSRLDQRSNRVEVKVKHIDKTVPEKAIASINFVSTNAITVNALCEDKESGIRGYRYSKDGGTKWTDETLDKSYKFNSLTTGTYKFKVKCINRSGLEKESEVVEQKTSEIPIPTCKIMPSTGWTTSKVITIDFGIEASDGLTYQYQIYQGSAKDNGILLTNKKWITSTTKVHELTMEPISGTDTGSILIQTTDGVNTKSGSTCMVTSLDIDPPTCTIDAVSKEDHQVNLSIKAKDPIGKLATQGYSWINDQTFDVENTKVVTSNGTYHAWVKDQAGNIGRCSKTITQFKE